jgi:hypothetical protein
LHNQPEHMKHPASFFQKLLPVAITLATAWAARGQIGHEYGAAWAGGIGVLALMVVSGREDWYARLPVIVALGSIGWGIGGIMSYGAVVGYGQVSDYGNVAYGLAMLVVIGGLYGFIGGGLTALAMESSAEKKIDWAVLFTQMFAGGFLCWGLLIAELDWLMTPPRSEMWAACLGASIALAWYLHRNGYRHALRTAFFSALGAGFGFGFGNFLQRMGRSTGIDFNWWNVMEYSIGFFGGLGMAYGVFSGGAWPKGRTADKISNTAGWVYLLILLPATCLIKGEDTKVMTGQLISTILSALAMLLMAWLVHRFHSRMNTAGQPTLEWMKKMVLPLTLIYLIWYILISNIIGATWLTPKFSSQHMYWANLIVLCLMLRKKSPPVELVQIDGAGAGRPISRTPVLLFGWTLAILLMLLLAYIAVSCSTASPHAQPRFQ